MKAGAALVLMSVAGFAAEPDILPTPQYLEPLSHEVTFAQPAALRMAQPHLEAARDVLVKNAPGVRFAEGDGGIVLWDYAADPKPGVSLNFLDRQLLLESPLRAQSYVLRSDGRSLWVVGGGTAGVLYGAATAAQLLSATDSGVKAPGVYIRDWPDFEFRAASDWLLHVEINRWALDRGQGMEAYGRLFRERLDRAARFKINMALVDGFGWSLETRGAGYAPLMRDVNRYARARGIRLMYGGYGAAYDSAQQSGEYQGTLFFNRERYPNGPVYSCLAFPEKKSGIDPRTMGGCRANDELNRLKGEDLRRFVEAVEPGALYIHHEDCCVFEDFQKAWLGRCERCRRRWPNDSLLAPDGGAGALAHGYSALIEAVNGVRHDDSGFAAARDTEIVLVSPVYMPATPRSEDWGQVLELWRQIAGLLPRTQNVQIAFREILPQPGGGKRWVELFNSMMQRDGRPYGAFVFVVGGADNYLTDYPLSGIPAMNAHFRGARTIYNSTGDFYREPMEVIAAEYSWNIRSTGFFRDPESEADMRGIEQWIYKPGEPSEIFGPGRLLDRVCARLYGPRAGPEMAAYYREAVPLPQPGAAPPPRERPYYEGRRARYVPRTWNYLTALPSYWNHLMVDSLTWDAAPAERYRGWMRDLNVEPPELHRRLAQRWQLSADLNTSGAARVKAALAASPPSDAAADLRFLADLFRAYQPLLEALRDYHAARAQPAAANAPDLIDAALAGAQSAEKLAESLFPQPVDPAMGEIRSLRHYPGKLAEAIRAWKDSQ